ERRLQSPDRAPRRLLLPELPQEAGDVPRGPLRFDEGALRGVLHPALQPEPGGEPVDERTEADPLDRTADLRPQAHDLRPGGGAVTGDRVGETHTVVILAGHGRGASAAQRPGAGRWAAAGSRVCGSGRHERGACQSRTPRPPAGPVKVPCRGPDSVTA